jgi:hypothetical protein
MLGALILERKAKNECINYVLSRFDPIALHCNFFLKYGNLPAGLNHGTERMC